MSIFQYLTETLISEKLPLSLARKYTKKGRENVETLPEEFVTAYDEMFGNKNRIQIGEVEIPQDNSKIRELGNEFNNISKLISDNIGNDVITNIQSAKDPKYVNMKFANPIAEKDFSQAYDNNKNAYLLKTVVKRLKKYVKPESYQEIQNSVGKYLTKTSDIAQIGTAPVILSRHPYDVAGMSTGKRWQSCKNVVDGCNRRYLDEEVGHLLIAFVVNPNAKGKDLLSDPYSRLLVMPVESGGEYGLYVSSDIYGANIPQFYGVVKNYVSEFMPVFDDNDEKEAVGNYYKDTGFENQDDGVERRWEEFETSMYSLTRQLRHTPSKFDDLLNEYFREKVMGDYVMEPNEIENAINNNDLRDIDNLFEYMDELDIDVDDYIDTFIDNDMQRFLDTIGDFSAEQIVHDLALMYPSSIDSYHKFEYMDNNAIIDSVPQYIEDIIRNDGTDALEDNGALIGALVEYAVRHEDVDWTSDWAEDIDVETMWNNSANIDFDDFYGFLRLIGKSHDEIVEIFGDSEEIAEDLKNVWDETLSKKD